MTGSSSPGLQMDPSFRRVLHSGQAIVRSVRGDRRQDARRPNGAISARPSGGDPHSPARRARVLIRTDFAMLVDLLFLLTVAAGPSSLDALRSTNTSASPGTLP